VIVIIIIVRKNKRLKENWRVTTSIYLDPLPRPLPLKGRVD